MRRFGMAALLISGTEAGLRACKHAAAQSWDQTLPDGGAIHRRELTYPRCIGRDRGDPDWVHDGPCNATDIGFIDKQRRVYFSKHPTDAESAARCKLSREADTVSDR
jgi:hypothetical protein